MPRRAASSSMEQLIREAVKPVIAKITAAIATLVAEQVERELRRRAPAPQPRRKAARRAARGRTEVTRWVADRRARRVPTFVIEQTGLATKKEIVARFGENASFEKGKAAPRPAAPAPEHAAQVVKAKPPIIRKKSSAAA